MEAIFTYGQKITMTDASGAARIREAGEITVPLGGRTLSAGDYETVKYNISDKTIGFL